MTRDDRLATRLFTLDRPIACPMCKRPGPSPLNAWPQPATWPDLGPAVEPLARDSPRWAELDHAGGAGSDVPDLLRRLEQGDAAAWEQLDPGVHHEVDVRESTYAAIPHIVRIAERAGSRADLGYLAKVVVSIRRAGRRPAGRFRADQVRPEPDAQLVRACEQAVARARARCLVDTLARLDGALGRSDLEIAGVLCGAVDDRHVVGHTANGGLTLFCGEGQHDFYVRFQGDDAVQVTL